MLQPPVHSVREILRIIVVKEIVIRQGKMPCRAAWGIGDQGHLAAGDGLQTGDGFDLDFGGMDIEIRVVEPLQALHG